MRQVQEVLVSRDALSLALGHVPLAMGRHHEAGEPAGEDVFASFGAQSLAHSCPLRLVGFVWKAAERKARDRELLARLAQEIEETRGKHSRHCAQSRG